MAFSGGSGTLGDPYLISNVTDLQNLYTVGANVVYFLQTNDITIGTLVRPFNSNGTTAYMQNYIYDANGYKIKDGSLSMSSYITYGYPSLFGYLDSSSQLKNLKVNNVSIQYTATTASIHCGVIVGRTDGLVTNCVVESNCSAINASSSGATGGIAGYTWSSLNSPIICSCSNAGSVQATIYAGGLVGRGRIAIINSYNSGFVKSTTYAAGLHAYADSGNTSYQIVNSYNSGNIEADNYVGGIVAYLLYGTIDGCFSLQSKIIKSIENPDNVYFGRVVGRVSAIPTNYSIVDCYALSTMVLSNGWL